MPAAWELIPISESHPAALYFDYLIAGDEEQLRLLFSGHPVVFDPQGGEIAGPDALSDFFPHYRAWLQLTRATAEKVAVTRGEKRSVAELLLHVDVNGKRIALPVAVAGDNADGVATADGGRVSALRVYHSMWPLDGEHKIRPPILAPDPGIYLFDVIEGYQRALAAGDLEGILAQFEYDGYFREPSGGDYIYRGKEELRGLMSKIFSNEGGIVLEHCTATDDGVRCAIEFNAVKWGKTGLPPQAGIAVYERGSSGKLAAARVYDDVTPPV